MLSWFESITLSSLFFKLRNCTSVKIHSKTELGNTVLIVGENFYSDQIIVIKDPQRIGNYKYTNNGGMPMVVPVIDSKSKE